MRWLAHSGRVARGLDPQTYSAHVCAVRHLANEHIREAIGYRTTASPPLQETVDWASTFHDLGKLETANQIVLGTKERGSLPVNHVDAGVAHLSAIRQTEAAIAVYAHHIGLCDIPAEMAKEADSRQDSTQAACRDHAIKTSTDKALPGLLQRHYDCVPDSQKKLGHGKAELGGLDRRLLLSSLVDADHTDTARHYGEQPDLNPAMPRWAERLQALDRYVDGLGRDVGSRASLRSEIYSTCRSASPETSIWACDSPVGSGKTTAIMAYLLQAAISLRLRHIFVVLPYTNIVKQSVDTYRKALVLPGEDAEKVVAAHHHQTEFSSPDLRFLTTLWDSPIIVTTAVQFFETLGANKTSRLRKLHQLPGSAVFIDEAHAAMPIHLWPFMWDQLKALSRDWSCKFVLGSGSLAKFWENPRIMGDGKTEIIPSMIPEDLRRKSSAGEHVRVRYQSRQEALSLEGLSDWIEEYSGARLVVINTVQTAAVVANTLRQRGVETLHLSTALAPADRDTILTQIRANLVEGPRRDWVLVATSCVEAGVDLSFTTAFRERSRAASLVQIGGRVNRHGEMDEGVVWDFIVNDPLLTLHPDFKHSRDVVEEIFRKNMWGLDLTALMTYALEQEFKRQSGEKKIGELFAKELVGAYPTVATMTRLIDADTRLVVVNATLIESIRRGDRVDRHALLAQSVQLWSQKIKSLALNQIGYGCELYAWEYEYDPKFLGVMAGVLKLNQIGRDGFALV